MPPAGGGGDAGSVPCPPPPPATLGWDRGKAACPHRAVHSVGTAVPTWDEGAGEGRQRDVGAAGAGAGRGDSLWVGGSCRERGKGCGEPAGVIFVELARKRGSDGAAATCPSGWGGCPGRRRQNPGIAPVPRPGGGSAGCPRSSISPPGRPRRLNPCRSFVGIWAEGRVKADNEVLQMPAGNSSQTLLERCAGESPAAAFRWGTRI